MDRRSIHSYSIKRGAYAMIKMGCLLFGLCVVLCFVPDLSPMVAQSETLLVIEECDFADKASSSVPGNGLVVWFEIATPCRKKIWYHKTT